MGRPATGCAVWRNDRWYAKVTLPDGSRPLVPLDKSIPQSDPVAAKKMALLVSQVARSGEHTKKTEETVAEYAARWLRYRREVGYANASANEWHLRVYILPKIGHLSIREVSRREMMDVVQLLDEKVRNKDLAWGTATTIWTTASSMFSSAAYSKRSDLRVRDDDPTDKVEPPDRGIQKSKAYLWPKELLSIMSSDMVPIGWKRLIAVAVYTYLRSGELRALQAEDIHLDGGYIHVHRSTSDDGATKSMKSRFVPIEPAIAPVLAVLVREAKGGPIFPVLPVYLARPFRSLLRRAKVNRADLHVTDATRRCVRFHDLRATGITWSAIKKVEPLLIMARAGHSDLETTMIYVREAENLREAIGAVFPALPAELSDANVTSNFSFWTDAAREERGKMMRKLRMETEAYVNGGGRT